MSNALSMGGAIVAIAGQLVGLPSVSDGGESSGSTLGDIPGTTHWWDATTASGLLSSGGAVTQYAGAAVTGVAGKIAGGANLATTVFSAGTTTATPSGTQVGRPHVNGLLGAVGPQLDAGGINPYGIPWPIMGSNQALVCAAAVTISSAANWWLALAWTRPNSKQQDFNALRPQGDRAPLVAVNTVELVGLNNTYRGTVTGADTGTLSVLGTPINTSMPLRHCGTVLLVHVAGAGISVYLNGSTTPAATGLSAASLPSGPAQLVFMGNPADTYFGASQCWFHEAAIGGTLTAPQIASALSALRRFDTGARKSARMVPQGQSNLSFVPGPTFDTLRSLVSYYTGAVSVEFTLPAFAPGRALYIPETTSYLIDSGGSDPSAWATGAAGVAQLATISGMLPVHQADLALGFGYHSEDASTPTGKLRGTYATAEPVHRDAWRRYATVLRAAAGKTAAQMPWAVTRAIPFGPASPEFVQMVSDSYNELAADSTAGFGVVIHNTWDSSGRAGADLIGQDGDVSHITDADHQTMFKRAAAPIARLLAASGISHTTLPAPGTVGGVAVSGPRITAAQFCNSTGATPSATPTGYVKVTVAHDTGDNLLLPGLASSGIGWTVRSGWSGPSARGTVILASAAAVLDSTHLLLTLASTPGAALASCRLLYCEGPTAASTTGRIGSGNAVTDNASSVTAAAGFDVAADLGPALAINYPLPSLPGGVAFT